MKPRGAWTITAGVLAIQSGKVEGPSAPIPHANAPLLVPQRCGSLLGGEPCDSYEDYGLGVRCIVHGGGFPDAMFPAVYNANMRIVQGPGHVAIMGDTRGRWDRTTLVVESSNFKAHNRGSSPGLRLVGRFTRTGRDAIQYQVTFIDPATWTAPWTAALDLKARPQGAGVFEYACHEGNDGMSNMLSAARHLERRTAGETK